MQNTVIASKLRGGGGGEAQPFVNPLRTRVLGGQF